MLFYKIDAEERNSLFHRASLLFADWLFFHFLTFPETSIKILRKLSNYFWEEMAHSDEIKIPLK